METKSLFGIISKVLCRKFVSPSIPLFAPDVLYYRIRKK